MAKGDIIKYNASLTQEQRRERASIAGKASAAAKLKYKTQRETIKQLLQCQDDERASALQALGLDPTYASSIAFAQLQKALTGDTEAFRAMRDTVGEKPTEAYQLAVGKADLSAVDMSTLTNEELAALAETE